MVEYLVAGAIVGLAYQMIKRDPLDCKEVRAIHEIFEECRFKNSKNQSAYVYKVIDKDSYKEFYINIPIGKSVSDLNKCLGAITTYFRNDVTIGQTQSEIYIKVYTRYLQDYCPYRTHLVDKSKGLCVVLGMCRDGVLTKTLSTDPHLSVIGATGSGKSTYVNALLCQLIENYTSDELELILLDLKGNELNEYKDLYHTKYHTTDRDEVVSYFQTLQTEMIERYKKLANHRNIQSYNKANPTDQLKYQFVVVEECYSLIGNKKAWNLLGDILSKARACGIHILLTTQRPTAEVIPALVTTHLGIRVGLKVNKKQESLNAIDMEGLERLTAHGSGIINLSGNYERIQGFYISDKQIEQITSKYREKKQTQSKPKKAQKDEPKKPTSLFI